MDITPYLTIQPAPRAVFDRLPTHAERPRFFVPQPGGGWQPVTWGEFARQIRACARFLTDVGIAPGDRAAIFAPNRVEWMSAALAIEAAGGVMVPIYPANTPDQAAYVALHSDAKVLFVDTPALLGRVFARWSEYAGVARVVLLDDGIDPQRVRESTARGDVRVPSADEVSARVVRWSDALAQGAALDARDPAGFERVMDAIDLDGAAVMLYTSGTSGNPKGVALSHRNVGVNGRDWLLCNAQLLVEDARDVLWLPMSHIFGFGEACLGNTLGFTTYLSDPASVLAKLPELAPDVFMSVPAYWEKLATQVLAEQDPAQRAARMAKVTGGKLKFCLSGGAGLKREIKELFQSCGVLIIEGYGLTETSPTLTLNRPDAFRFDSVGKPLPSVELRLAEDGEILARGPNVFRGYHKDPAATREAFTEDGWFKTGDVGRWTEDGFLQIIDRKKDILVTAGGKNVPPANIEVRFNDDPVFAHVVVYGDGRKYLVAGVWLNEAAVAEALQAARPEGASPAADDAALRSLVQSRIDRVNSQLANYETIKRFAIMPEALSVTAGTLTASLKVRRKKVYEAFRAHFEALYDERAEGSAAGAAGAGAGAGAGDQGGSTPRSVAP